MKDSMTALCLSLESGLAELVNSQDDWRLCALLSAARQGVAGVRRRAQDEAAGEDACRVAGEALGGAPSEPGADWCPTCGECPECERSLRKPAAAACATHHAWWEKHADAGTYVDLVGAESCPTCSSEPAPNPDCEGPGHIGPSSASNTPESKGKGEGEGKRNAACAMCEGKGAVVQRIKMLIGPEQFGTIQCPACAQGCPCGAPTPPGLAMCVECQAREGGR